MGRILLPRRLSLVHVSPVMPSRKGDFSMSIAALFFAIAGLVCVILSVILLGWQLAETGRVTTDFARRKASRDRPVTTVPPVTIHQFSRRGETRSDASEIRKAA